MRVVSGPTSRGMTTIRRQGGTHIDLVVDPNLLRGPVSTDPATLARQQARVRRRIADILTDATAAQSNRPPQVRAGIRNRLGRAAGPTVGGTGSVVAGRRLNSIPPRRVAPSRRSSTC